MAEDLRQLFQKYLQDSLNAEEAEVLLEAVKQGHNIEDIIPETVFGEKAMVNSNIEADKNAVYQNLVKIIERESYELSSSDNADHHVRYIFTRKAMLRWIAAAAVLIIAGIGAYLWNTTQKETPSISTTKPAPIEKEVLPGSEKAILVLADGRRIELDSNTKNVIYDGSLPIENSSKGLVYKSSDVVVNNTMTTPKGGQYKLTLADGTRVWLNAASAISYPTGFTGKTREVSVLGEAYFEVAKNAEKPFIVTTQKEKITVLGTSFNVNSYADEPASKTTLLEGVVKVNSIILKPGEACKNGQVFKTNVEKDIAWKNRVFSFENTSIVEAMRQIGRWYDLEIIYENGKIPAIKFGGEMGMDLKLSQVLKGLQTSGLKFRIEGDNKLVITQ